MNNIWIYASLFIATQPSTSIDNLDHSIYLDKIGLYETGWMIFEYHNLHNYGYPIEKT